MGSPLACVLRALTLAVTCRALNDAFLLWEKLLCSVPREHVGTDKHVQGCAGEEIIPEGHSPRLRARMLAVTCKMSLFESLILDRLHLCQIGSLGLLIGMHCVSCRVLYASDARAP